MAVAWFERYLCWAPSLDGVPVSCGRHWSKSIENGSSGLRFRPQKFETCPTWGTKRASLSSTALAGGESERGLALVELSNGRVRQAELHWYEASGIGKKEFKIKRFVD